jgi:dipeptidyl aminopeptidase/acylaminoacyl peptidase
MTLIDDLLDLQVPTDIQISPNNQQILYSTSLPGLSTHRVGDHAVSTIWLATTGHPGSAKQLTSGEYNDQHPRWSPDGKSLALISDRPKAGEKWAIYTLAIAGDPDPEPVTSTESETSIKTFSFSPDGRSIAYISSTKTQEQIRREKEKDDANVYGNAWKYQGLHFVDLATKEVLTLFNNDRHVLELVFLSASKIAFLHTKTTTM